MKVETLGCRLNGWESRAMEELGGDLSDVVVVNTCAVTGEAVRQAAQTIRRLRRENPAARLVVTGCAAQVEPGRFADMPEVDHVLGNAEKLTPAPWAGLREGVQPRVSVGDIMAVRDTAGHLIDGVGDRSRAHVQIQTGCDHRCTFCIIPYGRGPSRSVPAGVVVEQIRRLRDRGFEEVVLTGVDLTSWGGDLPGAPRLGALVGQILRLTDVPRLRLSSIDGIEADPALVEAIGGEPRVMPHVHLSLQAGDDLILKRMKRRHLRGDAIRFCAALRAARPEIAFGADLIAGFPTETEAMFENSLRLVEECGLTWLHVFPFSPRPGTPAARMPQVPRRVAKARAARLRAAGASRVAAHLAAQIGREIEVLAERADRARAPDFAPVRLSRPAEPGRRTRIRVAAATEAELIA